MVRLGKVGAPVVLLSPEEQPLFCSDSGGAVARGEEDGVAAPAPAPPPSDSHSQYGSVVPGGIDAAASASAQFQPHSYPQHHRHGTSLGDILLETVSETMTTLLEPVEHLVVEPEDAGECHNPLHDHDHSRCEHGTEEEEATAPSTSYDAHPHGAGYQHQQHLRLVPLAILVFYNVSGGPFGVEETVRAGGNFYALLGFLFFPLVGSVPEALVTAELGSAFPEAAGGVAWVETAFGAKSGLLCGYLNWVAGATDNAIYPTLFVEYLTSVLGATTEAAKEDLGVGWVRFFYVSALTLVLAAINYRGLEIVGAASVLVCFLAMSPFVVMCFLAIKQIDSSKWLQMPLDDAYDDGAIVNGTDTYEALLGFDDDAEMAGGPVPLAMLGGVLWRPYLNNLFWNLNSFDAVASFAGEVRDIKRTYPPGIFLGLFLCITFYFVPLLAATGATESSREEWVDGHLAAIAAEIGGPWLGGWVVFAAGVSNLALFEAEMSADAYQLMGMAERGFLPRVFAERSKYGTPKYGILVGTVVIVCFSVADFGQLLEMLNMNYAMSLLMEYAAFVKLRYTHRHVERPFRIPVPNWAAVLLILPPSIMMVVIFAISSWKTLIFVFMTNAWGVGFFGLLQRARCRGWCDFMPSSDYIQQISLPSIGEDEPENDGVDSAVEHAIAEGRELT